MDFSQILAVVMDMDGVLWRGNERLPGMVALFDLLKQRGLPFILATNNATRTAADYVQKLAEMGVSDVPESAIITSGIATTAYLRAHYPAGTRVHVLGGSGLHRTIADAGYPLVDEGAQVVVAGADFELTYAKLKRAALLILEGAVFIGTNPDPNFPSPEGLIPGAGSIIAALATATERQPFFIGKPGTPMFESALTLLGTSASATLMIGDRLSTDILGGQNANLKTALVLTGVTTRDELANSSIQPDGVYDDLPALLDAWNGNPV